VSTSASGEQALEALLDHIAVGVAQIDREGRFAQVNESFARAVGRSAGELAGTRLGEIVHPDDWPALRAELDDLLAGRRDHLELGTRVARPDAAHVRLHAVVSRAGDDRVVAVVQDVTGRRLAEDALRQSELRFEQAEAMLRGHEERFARFMQHLPGLAWIKDAAGRYLFVNDTAARAFRRTRAELYGRTDAEVFPAATSAQFRQNDEKALVTGAGLETIETLEHEDGVHHSLVAKFPIPGPDGVPAWVGGIAIDITERIRAEEALRETEARFRDMADNAPVLIWVNGDTGCEFVNREYLQFTGASTDELRGDGWRRFLHPDDADPYIAEYLRNFAARRHFEAQFRFRRADGEYRWLRSTGVPRLRADGSLLGYVGCSVDITDIKRSEEALRDADRRKDEFLATLAHELRNPLAPIRSSLQVLREVAAAGDVCAMLERQVDQMVRLVEDLLEVSRITRGRVELRRERVDLASVLRAALETSRPAIDAGGHAFALSLPDEALAVEADPVRLAQVFVNLLDNAAKYTPDGGHVALGAERAGDEVRVWVRDDGVGIPRHVLPRVFEPFTQVSHTLPRAAGGLGIGLALVAQLVDLHGGKIAASSEGDGRGSEFVVTLPLAARAEAQSRATPTPSARAAQKNGQRVLVVDDNRDAAESLALLLRTRGVDCDVAHDGPAALERVRARAPTVVLLDLGMPGMDGYEVARRLRKEPAGRAVQLVAVTGWGQPEVHRRCREAGFDRHLVKPVGLESLEALLGLPPREKPAHS
jgi:PAS domain S-box-containing protein